MKHVVTLGDRELATIRRDPCDLDLVLAVKLGRPYVEIVFCGDRNSFLLVIEVALRVAIVVRMVRIADD